MTMEKQFPLCSKHRSKCHGAKCAIVRSREGGMVSQNCIQCGEPEYVRPEDFPDVPCQKCNNVQIIKKMDETNYYFVCVTCNIQCKVADVVPNWSDHFDYHGLAAFGDDIPGY
ncbi:MAG: hypothetical protein ACLP7O_12170 [Terracidiphilus sp.]